MFQPLCVAGRTIGLTALALAAGQVLAQSQPPAPAEPAASQPAAAKPASPGSTVLPEVTVTAQKVAQPASKTPVALSVLGGEDLKDAGIGDARALADAVPNVVIGQDSGKLMISIRGVMSMDTTEKGDPSAAFNVDGAYVARPEAQLGSFLDLERIEVLRGPQGTLYGRNATSGAINLITNKPTSKFGARIEGEVGNFNTKRAEGMINVPINDVLSMRAAVSAYKRDGYVNPGPNTDTPMDSRDDYAGRVHLLAKFTKDTSLLLTAETSHQGGGSPTPVPIGNFYTGTYIDRLPFSPPNTGNNIQDPVRVERGSDAQRTAGLRFNGPNVFTDTTNDSARAEFKTSLGFAELTYQLAYMKGSGGGSGNGIYFGFPFRADSDGNSNSTSHELRLNSVGDGPLRWVAGAYLFDEKIHREMQFNTFISAPFGDFTVNLPFDIDVRNKSKALFGQATYAVTPATRLTLGLRGTRDQKHGEDKLGGVAAVPPDTISTGAYSKTVKFSNSSWRLGVDHDLMPGTMIYATAATGYKAGGFNDTSDGGSYNPEKLRALELGVKTKLFEDRLQLSAAVFDYDYKDMQVTSVVCTTPDPASCGSLTTNAARAKLRGLELEGRWLSSDNGQWRGAVSFNNAKFDSYQPNATTDWAGQRLDRVAKAVMTIGYTHRFPLASGAEISASIGQRLSSSYTISDPEAGVRYVQPSFHKSDASIGWTDANGKLSVQAFVKNIEDTITIETRVPGSFFVGDPRTFGVRAIYNF